MFFCIHRNFPYIISYVQVPKIVKKVILVVPFLTFKLLEMDRGDLWEPESAIKIEKKLLFLEKVGALLRDGKKGGLRISRGSCVRPYLEFSDILYTIDWRCLLLNARNFSCKSESAVFFAVVMLVQCSLFHFVLSFFLNFKYLTGNILFFTGNCKY